MRHPEYLGDRLVVVQPLELLHLLPLLLRPLVRHVDGAEVPTRLEEASPATLLDLPPSRRCAMRWKGTKETTGGGRGERYKWKTLRRGTTRKTNLVCSKMKLGKTCPTG